MDLQGRQDKRCNNTTLFPNMLALWTKERGTQAS